MKYNRKIIQGGMLTMLLLVGCTQPTMTPNTNGPRIIEDQAGGMGRQAFAVSLATSTPSQIVVGDKMVFRFSSSAPGFAHLYLLSSSGKVSVMVENLRLDGGVVTTYPDPTTHTKLAATPPSGVERAILLVTNQTITGFGGAPGQTVTLPQSIAFSADSFMSALDQLTGSMSRHT